MEGGVGGGGEAVCWVRVMWCVGKWVGVGLLEWFGIAVRNVLYLQIVGTCLLDLTIAIVRRNFDAQNKTVPKLIL